eukprot:TRINITY_DN604_c0_g1_i4.p1 TRINITY_DN604_c0_g1~~TRINITY_DN604_c0_g1_i4.p1  ORF type:complete len:133 (+),score=39.28 TRINITY_DN604_c0_g1_i4:81-479(+)
MKFSLLLALSCVSVFQSVVSQMLEEDLVDMGYKGKKFCLDKEGNKYKKNEQLTGMCEEYTCSFKKKKYTWKAMDLKTCCKVDGMWYPMQNTVYSEEYGASTAMNYICDWDLQVRPHIEQKGCNIWGKQCECG